MSSSGVVGGETVAGLVIEIGQSSVRAGYSGDDCPKAIFPSMVGVVDHPTMENESDEMRWNPTEGITQGGNTKNKKYFVGEKNVRMRKDFMNLESMFDENGIVDKWDHFERIMDYTLTDRLNVNPSEHPILLNEKPFATREEREKKVQILFEKFNAQAVFIAKDPVLTAFSAGKSTALVVDSGYNGTVVTPVFEGYALTKSIVRNKYGGRFLSEKLYEFLAQRKKVNLRPSYLIEKKKDAASGKIKVNYLDFPNTTKSFYGYMLMDCVNQIKEGFSNNESIFKVQENPFIEEQNKNSPVVNFELNDGTNLEIGNERFSLPEFLFTPSAILEAQKNPLLQQQQQQIAPPPSTTPISSSTALHQLAYESIMKCDVDVRKELFSNTILTGGNTMFDGVVKRFEKELQVKAPPTIKVKTPIAQSQLPVEKKFSVWIGGSILSTVGSFQQMWISKKMYDEHGTAGVSLVHKMCP